MRTNFPAATSFSFESRPIPVPGDLRINWRIALILMMLALCRGKKASLAKLHILNDAVRSGRSRTRLESYLATSDLPSTWQVRVEPAFGRALDFVIGEGFANWIKMSGKAGIQITESGLSAHARLKTLDGVLEEEKAFLQKTAQDLTEARVRQLLHASGAM